MGKTYLFPPRKPSLIENSKNNQENKEKNSNKPLPSPPKRKSKSPSKDENPFGRKKLPTPPAKKNENPGDNRLSISELISQREEPLDSIVGGQEDDDDSGNPSQEKTTEPSGKTKKKIKIKEEETEGEENEEELQKREEKERKRKKRRRREKKKKKKNLGRNYPVMSLLYSSSALMNNVSQALQNSSDFSVIYHGFLKHRIKRKKENETKQKWVKYYVKLIGIPERHLDFYENITEGQEVLMTYNLEGARLKTKDKGVFEIATAEKPEKRRFYLKTSTIALFDEWVLHLRLPFMEDKNKDKKLLDPSLRKKFYFGGIDEHRDDHVNIPIVQNPFTSWTEADVMNWLSKIRVSYTELMHERYGTYFEQNGINGHLIEVFFLKQKDFLGQILAGLGVRNPKHIQIMSSEILRLEKSKYFDMTPFVVQEKVTKMFLKHTGQTDPDKITKTFDEYLKYCEHFHDLKSIYKTVKYILTKHEDEKKGAKSYKVKFIVTENIQDWRVRQVRKLLGLPIVMGNKLGLTDIKFGMFHVALAIGPLQLEWVDNSLCLIRSISSENVLLCVDVGVYHINDIDQFSLRVAKECKKWNRDYTYETLNIKHKKWHANCQQYVEYFVYGILNLKLEFSSCIENYLKSMKEYGKTAMTFSYDSKFANAFDITPNSGKNMNVDFTCHQQLDQFVNKIIEKNPMFRQEYPDVYELLKGFDRAFWMKHLQKFKQQKNNARGIDPQSFKSEHSPSENGCPFNIQKKQ